MTVLPKNLHHWLARAYDRAERDYRDAFCRGDEQRIADTLTRKRALEKGVVITIVDPKVLT